MKSLLAQEYLRELHVVRQVSQHTIAAYTKDLDYLLARLDEQGLELAEVTSDHVRSWVVKLHSQGQASRSIARMLSAWRGFYLWLANQKGLVNKSPLSDIKAPKRKKPLPKALSVEQAINLVESANKESVQADDFLRARDRAIVELLYSSGLRLSELLGIDLNPIETKEYSSAGWIDFEAGEVMVLGKGKKRRTVPVGEAALHALKDWLAVRANHALTGKEVVQALFM